MKHEITIEKLHFQITSCQSSVELVYDHKFSFHFNFFFLQFLGNQTKLEIRKPT